jgi:hypothetical protein
MVTTSPTASPFSLVTTFKPRNSKERLRIQQNIPQDTAKYNSGKKQNISRYDSECCRIYPEYRKVGFIPWL